MSNLIKRIKKHITIKMPFAAHIYHVFKDKTEQAKSIITKKIKAVCLFSSIIWTRVFDHQVVFLLLTPKHGNLGDHAIAYAESLLLRRLGFSFFEVTGEELYLLKEQNLLHVFNRRPVLINGGGYLGTIWPDDDNLVREIILHNPDSNILLFPNSIVYEDTLEGKQEYQKAKDYYKKRANVKVYAREDKSFQIFSDMFINVGSAPDMVMMLKEDKESFNRIGGGICLRNDRERTLSEKDRNSIIDNAHLIFGDKVESISTILPYAVEADNREEELRKLFDLFRKYQLIITDRLHGMIFGAITGTPTIVVDSKSHKVRGCYEWIKHLPYIVFCENPQDIPLLFEQIKEKNHCYDNKDIINKFKSLTIDIQSIRYHNWPQ